MFTFQGYLASFIRFQRWIQDQITFKLKDVFRFFLVNNGKSRVDPLAKLANLAPS